MIELPLSDADDPSFIELVCGMSNNAFRCYSPNEVYVTGIDGWFDHKWLEFSGKIVGAVGVWNTVLTVPPFNPNRVLYQLRFWKDETGSFRTSNTPEPLHLNQPSGSNTNRFMNRVSSSGLFIWYGGNKRMGDMGSLLVYDMRDEVGTAWYASFKRAETWQLNKVRGISKREVIGLMKIGN